MSLRNKRYTSYNASTGQLIRNKIFKTNNENKKKILTDVRNNIDDLYSSYTKNTNINNKKLNNLEANLKNSLAENKQLRDVISKYQQYSKKLENGYTTLQLKQQQQQRKQQKQVKFVDSDYEEDNDLQDLEVQAGPNEKKDRKLLAQRYPKYHYQNRNRNGKLTILKKPKQQKVYKKQQLKRQLEEQHTEDKDEEEFDENDNELNQFLE